MKAKTSLLLLVAGVTLASLAEVFTWTGNAGNHQLFEADNWDLGTVPSNGDALVVPMGDSATFHQTLADFAPRSVLITNAVYATGQHPAGFDGEPFVVGDEGLRLEIDLPTAQVSLDNGLVGAGTFTFTGPSVLAPDYVSCSPRNHAPTFAGRLVLDNSAGFEIANRVTVLGDDQPETLIPDAITLGGLSSLKNFQGSLLIPSWQGVRLVNGGGGFCAGWSSADAPDRAITVDGPITGDGRLYIARCACPVILNSPLNAWTGGTEIGSTNTYSYTANVPTELRLGPDAAFPQGGELVVGAWGPAVLDVNGHDITVDTLNLFSGSVIRNSSDRPVTISFRHGVLWGAFEGPITLDYDPDQVDLIVEDDQPWVGRFCEAPAGEVYEATHMRTGGLALKLTGGTLALPATAGFGMRKDGSWFNTRRMRGLDGVVSSAEMGATSAGWPENTTYYYQSLWYVPETGLYRFMKSFDDGARLMIDGRQVLSNTAAGDRLILEDVPIAQGWHEVGVWFGNSGGPAGPGNGYRSGLLYGPAGSRLDADGKAFDTADGTFVFMPLINQPLHYGAGGGTVVVAADATVSAVPSIFIEGGVIAEADATADDALVLTEDTRIGTCDTRHVAVFDANVTMAAGKTLTFQGDVWLKRCPPAGYQVAPGTVVYLSAETLALRAELVAAGAVLGYAPFNAAAFGETVQVASGETFVAKTSVNVLGYEPLVNDVATDDGKVTCTAAFVVADGGVLDFDNSAPWRQEGRISGAGQVRVSKAIVNFVADNSDFVGQWTCIGRPRFSTVASAGGAQATVRVEGEVGLEAVEPYPQTFVTAGGRFISHALNEVRLEHLAVDAGTPAITVDGLTLYVAASGFQATESVALQGSGQFALDVDVEGYQLPNFTGRGKLGLSGVGSVNILSLAGFEGTFAALSPTVRLRFEPQMAPNPAFWLDASKTETLTMLDAEQIDAWRDARDGASGTAYPACYRTRIMPGWVVEKNCNPPTLVHDDTVVQGQAVDFGTYNSGKWFAFNRPVQAQTIFYVINSRNGGGGCFFSYSMGDKAICRNAPAIDAATIDASCGLYNSQSWANAVFASSASRMNGEACSSTATGLSGGWDVVSSRLSSAQTLDAIAKDVRPLTGGHANDDKRAGGMAYAEFIVYDRALTDAEIAATEAYLMAKWLPRRTGAGAGLNGSLTVGTPTTIEVPAPSQSAYVESLKGSGTLAKAGEGVLWLKNLNAFDGTVDVQDGELTLGLSLPSPAFWVDANTQTGKDEDGRFFWRDCRWDGVTDYVVATQRWATAPSVLANACGTLSAVDFGALSQHHDRGLQWSRLVNAQTIFMVIGSQNSGGTILGTNDDSCWFNRMNMTKASDPIYSEYVSGSILNGETRLDGVVVNGRKTGFSGGYQVLTVRATAEINVGQFAHDRELTATERRDGGQRLGEVLVFTESLNDAQVNLVEGYLRKKWFAGETTRRLYGASDLAQQEAPHIQASGSATALSTVARTKTLVKAFSGAGDVTLNGDGTLALQDANGYTGTVTVAAGGRLELAGLAAQALADATFWVDASAPASMDFKEGTREVTRWNDVRANGRFAARAPTEASGSFPNLNPVLLENELNGRSVLDFGEWMGNRFLVFDRPIHNIRTVFWVIGSQAGGGLLLGYSGDTGVRDFYRAGGGDGSDWATIVADNPLWTRTVTTPVLEVADAPTRLNGVDVDGCAVGLSGAYDLVSVRTTGNVRASAFGMDRDRRWRNATGGQRLAEVIIFQRELSADETTAIEQYLAQKWGQTVTHAHPLRDCGPSLSVTLADGDLALTPYGTYDLGVLGGCGRVQGAEASFSVTGLHNAATDDATAALEVEPARLTVAPDATWTVDLDAGTAPICAHAVSFQGGGTLVVNRAPSASFGPQLLLKTDSLEGFNPHAWRLHGKGGPSYRLVPHEDGGIYLELSQGSILIFR